MIGPLPPLGLVRQLQAYRVVRFARYRTLQRKPETLPEPSPFSCAGWRSGRRALPLTHV